MRVPDDLVRAFSRAMPERVAAFTELWLGFERGQQENLPVLRRLLHTVKGEAHMLELGLCGELSELAESVVDCVRRTGTASPGTGDALLCAFEGLAMVSSEEALEELPDIEPLLQQLRTAVAGFDGLAREAVTGNEPTAGTEASKDRAERVAPILRADDVRPLVHEMKRLFGEQTILHDRLREVQRMLRALLQEIDPKQTAAELAERITKTLGYGTEIDRRLSGVRSDWSSNEFATKLTLDSLDGAVRRALVIGTDRLLNQVLRVGRSTMRTLAKDVELRVSGDAILDSAIEQRLEAALIHLIRNAIDHGVEPPEVRQRSGKAERAVVEVSINQTESSVTVEVKDDGAGIDFDRLRRVLAPRVSNVEALPDDDLLPYLLEQGVTTSEGVTTISGRGVGLDVVAREVAAAGGQLRIHSTRGLGTRFVLELPATLFGELAVPLTVTQQRYAIASRAVHSAVRIESLDHSAEGASIRVQRQGEWVPVRVFSLGALLGDGGEPSVGQSAVVLHHATGLFALAVDGYDTPRPITTQRMEELPMSSELVSAVAPTPDGGVLLVLNVEALHSAARGVSPRGNPSRPARLKRSQPCALVVEDAPVARELLCGILRSLGLRVEEAVDGRQGLAIAQREVPDVVVTDIEMPHMDGIEMIQCFRDTLELTDLPIVVLTTATSVQNRQRLEDLGVRAVLSKQSFVEAELRELIERCVGRD